jgi:hypothetical protein
MIGDTVYIRFLHNTGDIIFENGESPQFKQGQIISAEFVEHTPSGGDYVRIDWGCGQTVRIYSKLSKFVIVPAMEVIALVAAGELELDA